VVQWFKKKLFKEYEEVQGFVNNNTHRQTQPLKNIKY